MDLAVPFLEAYVCNTTIQKQLLEALVEVLMDGDGWNLKLPPKFQVLATFSLRPAARITLFRLRTPLRNELPIGGIGPVRAP